MNEMFSPQGSESIQPWRMTPLAAHAWAYVDTAAHIHFLISAHLQVS